MSGKTAAIYVRVSSEKQAANYSPASQEAAIRVYAAEHGYTVSEAHVYHETHSGSELFERPALTRAREAMARREFDCFICYDPDRFSRNQVHTAMLQHFCERAGVELRFAMFDFEQNATGQFMLNARAFAAELELEKLKERTQRGRVSKMRSGKLAGNTPAPYGYKYNTDRTKYEADPATAPIVRRIFQMAAEGTPLRAIAMTLTKEAIPSPSGMEFWPFTTIRSILKNPSYTGVVPQRATRTARVLVDGQRRRVTTARPADEQIVTEGVAPCLIDPATFQAVAERLERNARESTRNQRDPESYLLRSGHIQDAATGRAMICDRNNKGTPQYRHRVLRPQPGDREHVIGATSLDAQIWAFTERLLLDPDIIGLRLFVPLTPGPVGDDPAEVADLLATVQRRMANTARAIAALDDPDASVPLEAELKSLAAQKRSLEGELRAREAARSSQDEARQVVQQFRDFAMNYPDSAAPLTYEQKRSWLAALHLIVHIRPYGVTPRYSVSIGVQTASGMERIVFNGTSTPAWVFRSMPPASASAASVRHARSTSASAPST